MAKTSPRLESETISLSHLPEMKRDKAYKILGEMRKSDPAVKAWHEARFLSNSGEAAGKPKKYTSLSLAECQQVFEAFPDEFELAVQPIN